MKQPTPTITVNSQNQVINYPRAASSLKDKRGLTVILPVGERFSLKNYPCNDDQIEKKQYWTKVSESHQQSPRQLKIQQAYSSSIAQGLPYVKSIRKGVGFTKMNYKSRLLDEPFFAISNLLKADIVHQRSKTVMVSPDAAEDIVTLSLPQKAQRIFKPLEVISDEPHLIATGSIVSDKSKINIKTGSFTIGQSSVYRPQTTNLKKQLKITNSNIDVKNNMYSSHLVRPQTCIINNQENDELQESSETPKSLSKNKQKPQHKFFSSISPLRIKSGGMELSIENHLLAEPHPILKTNSKHMKFIINTAKAYFHGETGKELHKKVKSIIKTIGNTPRTHQQSQQQQGFIQQETLQLQSNQLISQQKQMEGGSNHNGMMMNTTNSKTVGNGAVSSHHLWQQMNQMPKFSTSHINQIKAGGAHNQTYNQPTLALYQSLANNANSGTNTAQQILSKSHNGSMRVKHNPSATQPMKFHHHQGATRLVIPVLQQSQQGTNNQFSNTMTQGVSTNQQIQYSNQPNYSALQSQSSRHQKPPPSQMLNSAGQSILLMQQPVLAHKKSSTQRIGGAPSQLSSISHTAQSKLKLYQAPQTLEEGIRKLGIQSQKEERKQAEIGGQPLGRYLKANEGDSLSNISPSRRQSTQMPTPAPTVAVKQVNYSLPGVKIGSGKFGPIELVIYKNELCALKRIPKNSIDKAKRIEHLKNEKKVNLLLRQLATADKGSKASEFFCRMEETFADADSINFIFEYCPGQDLFWVVQNEMNLKMGGQGKAKDWVKFYAAEILLALEILHQQKVVYRDLKPENVVIDVNGHVKLIDFGFAKRLNSSSNPKHHYRTHTNCGTLGYTAPEVLMNLGASFEADIWSFGILLCEMLSGQLPFENRDDPQAINEQIAKCELKLPRESDQTMRDLLQQIFVLEPNLRLSLQDMKQHKFFSEVDWRAAEMRRLEPVPYKPNPMKYKYLLSNKYEVLSSLQAQSQQRKGTTTPNAQLEAPESLGEGDSPVEGDGSPKNELEKVGPVKVGHQRNDSPTKRNILGDLTIYRINKEFENF